jgi:hypothetical protein
MNLQTGIRGDKGIATAGCVFLGGIEEKQVWEVCKPENNIPGIGGRYEFHSQWSASGSCHGNGFKLK